MEMRVQTVDDELWTLDLGASLKSRQKMESPLTGHDLQIVVVDFRPTKASPTSPGHDLQIVVIDFQPMAAGTLLTPHEGGGISPTSPGHDLQEAVHNHG